MPITDYRVQEVAVVAAPVMWRLRAYWSRLFKRDGIEGHRVDW